MPFLPEEIVRQILPHLPVKSLLRFRSVSKLWRSIIDGKQFIQLHLRQSLNSNSNRTLLVDSSQFYCVDLDSFKLSQVGNAQIEPYSLIATCDGLVLLVQNSGDTYLWNPATRKQRILLEQPKVPDRINCFEHVQCFFAFGHDSEHDDYKIVRVVQSVHEGYGGGFSTATIIYSLKANTWKTGKDFPYLLPCHGPRWGIYLNGAFHTVVPHGSNRQVIKAFDLGKEEHRELPLPAYRRTCAGGWGRRSACVEKLGGCLATIVIDMMRSEIWLMKEYGVKQSWMKLLHFDSWLMGPRRDLRPLVYSKNGEEVLFNNDGVCLYWYSLREKCARYARVSGVSDSFNTTCEQPFFEAEVCVGSLVSPFSPAEEEAQKHKSSRKVISKKRDDFLSTGFKLRL